MVSLYRALLITRRFTTLKLSINIGKDTLHECELTISEYMLLGFIYSFTRNEKECNMSRKTLACYLDVSEATIERLYKQLKEKKYIYIELNNKKLTKKAIEFCKGHFEYKATKKRDAKHQPGRPKKKEVKIPSWYERYRQSLSEEDKKRASETLPKDMQKVIKDVFGED